MPISHDEFNSQVVGFANDIESAISAFEHNGSWQIDAAMASSDSSRLRSVIEANVELRASEESTVLAELSAVYKLCVDSLSQYLAVEHSSFVLKAKLDRSPIIRWDYDRDARSKPSSHVQITAHRGALSHILSRLDHQTPHSMESLHLPMGGDRFRPCLEDVVEFLIRDCGFAGSVGWKQSVRDGRAKWRRIQTRAVVRDSPNEAVKQLEAMGYIVTAPQDGAPDERTEKLTSW